LEVKIIINDISDKDLTDVINYLNKKNIKAKIETVEIINDVGYLKE
jgi:hypothetical protein